MAALAKFGILLAVLSLVIGFILIPSGVGDLIFVFGLLFLFGIFLAFIGIRYRVG